MGVGGPNYRIRNSSSGERLKDMSLGDRVDTKQTRAEERLGVSSGSGKYKEYSRLQAVEPLDIERGDTERGGERGGGGWMGYGAIVTQPIKALFAQASDTNKDAAAASTDGGSVGSLRSRGSRESLASSHDSVSGGE